MIIEASNIFHDASQTVIAIGVIVTAITGWATRNKVSKVGDKLAKVERTTDATHTLSNSQMEAQLKATLAALTALSISQHRHYTTTGLEADMAAANAIDVQVIAANQALLDHVARQAVVDSKEAK